MEHAFCDQCGCGLYQSPKNAPFRAVFPPNMRFEDGPFLSTLPDDWKPRLHINYDNRAMDMPDGLPKYARKQTPGIVTGSGGKVPKVTTLLDDAGNAIRTI